MCRHITVVVYNNSLFTEATAYIFHIDRYNIFDIINKWMFQI